jgi:thiamine-phosphate pyrophosphorylase
MQLCAITDRKHLAGEDEAALRQQLQGLVAGWIEGGVEFIQLREKDLNAYRLGSLAAEIMAGMERGQTKLLLNLPASAAWLQALAPVADGVHIPGAPKRGTAELVRQSFEAIGRQAIVSMACHSVREVEMAREERADLALFAPVFEKPGEKPQGLSELRRVCEVGAGLPVFALGGVTASNAHQCVAAGAAGVAGIRLFAGEEWRRLKTEPS